MLLYIIRIFVFIVRALQLVNEKSSSFFCIDKKSNYICINNYYLSNRL